MRVFILALISICFSGSFGDLTARVKFPELPSMVTRNCKLPTQLKVEMVVEDQTINLNLTKSKIQENGKVLLVKAGTNGKPELVDNKPQGKNVGILYRGNSNLAAVEVFCRMEDRRAKLSLEGSIELSDNRMYRIVNIGEDGLYTLVLENTDSTVFTAALPDEDDSPLQHRFKRASTDPVIHQDIYIDIVALVHFSVFLDFYDRSTETDPALALADTVDRLQRHFAHLFNAVDVRFKTASEKLNINLAATIIETEASGDWFDNVVASQTPSDPTKIYAPGLLDEMNVYRLTEGIPVHDHFTSFTSVDMYWVSNGAVQDIAGLATLSRVCQYSAKTVSTVEFQDNLSSDVRITAHEVGHCLGSPHDGLGQNPCDSGDNYIMSGAASHFTDTNPFQFSQCSADYFGKYINTLIEDGRSEFLQCLYEPLAPADVPDVSGEVLGQMKSTDDQCRDAYGPDSFHCKASDKGNVCLYMFCWDPVRSTCYKEYGIKGTTCGDRMWCDAGNCVYHPDAPRADPTCLWGDELGLRTNGKTCPEFIQHAGYCSETNRKFCCETCQQYDPACSLNSSSCSSPQVFDDFLCECVDATTTAPTTTLTTTTTTSTTITTTTPTTTTQTTTTITDSTTPSPSTSTTTTTTTPTTATTTQTSTTESTTESTTPTTTSTTATTTPTSTTTPTTTTQTTTTITDSTTTSTSTSTSTTTTTPTTATTTQTSTDFTTESTTPTTTQTTTATSTTVSTTTPTTTSTTATTTTTTPSTTASSSCATAPEIPNSEVTVTDDVAIYTCQEGTLPFGGVDSGDTSTCTDGVWSPTTLQCRNVSSCYQKSGRYAVYSGTQSTTNDGHTCQAWIDQSPIAHSHGSKDVHFNTVAGYTENPTVEAQSNFCRDPYGFGKPFCFTLTPGVRIDYCDEVIPQCECPDPPIVANAEVVVVDNRATYSCEEGFVATSPTSSVSTCTNGLWSAVNIKCHDVSQCYVVSGGSRHYTGTHSTTRNGNTCQAWTEKTPHVHSYEAKHFIRVAGEDTTLAEHGNYCRDPSGYGRASLGSLWCFTTNPSKRREICSNVPRCVL